MTRVVIVKGTMEGVVFIFMGVMVAINFGMIGTMRFNVPT